jgi:type IV secretion system protein VirB5
MTPTKLLIGQLFVVLAIIVASMWTATQWAAATRRGAQFLSEHARRAAPFAHIGEQTVSVQVTSIVRASDSSFQVKWTETAFERGAQDGVSRWTAILTTVTRTPASAEVLRKNPLGIYIDAIDWSRELDTGALSAPAAAPPSPARAPSAPGLAEPMRQAPAPITDPRASSNLPLGSPLEPTPPLVFR